MADEPNTPNIDKAGPPRARPRPRQAPAPVITPETARAQTGAPYRAQLGASAPKPAVAAPRGRTLRRLVVDEDVRAEPEDQAPTLLENMAATAGFEGDLYEKAVSLVRSEVKQAGDVYDALDGLRSGIYAMAKDAAKSEVPAEAAATYMEMLGMGAAAAILCVIIDQTEGDPNALAL